MPFPAAKEVVITTAARIMTATPAGGTPVGVNLIAAAGIAGFP
jgi:hypothetical protein